MALAPLVSGASILVTVTWMMAQRPPAAAAEPPGALRALEVRHAKLAGGQRLVSQAPNRGAGASSAMGRAWTELERATSVKWLAYVDRLTGLVAFAEGGGIAMIPGRANGLSGAGMASQLSGRSAPDLEAVERIVRGFLPRVAPLLGVESASLVLNRHRSGHPAEHLWFVDFDVTSGGTPIEGARVVFRINNGNLIQFGTERLPAPGAVPAPDTIDREQARTVMANHIGGVSAADVFLDAGSLHLLPVLTAATQGLPADLAARGPAGPAANGRGLARVWQFVFRRPGVAGTWRARVDAATGELLEFGDSDQYAVAQVTGGVAAGGDAGTPEVVRPMPYAVLSTGGFTNSAGLFESSGQTTGAGLSGWYVKLSDTCGTAGLISDADGNLLFGLSGDDCSTSGIGGPGNTSASRSQAYLMNRATELGRGWLPGADNTVLVGGLSVFVNVNQACYAATQWPGIGLGRSGGGCANAGENPGISLHELGHAIVDSYNVGLAGITDTSGETSGDWTAALVLHESCIGAGYLQSNCDGYGDACTSCTGPRDIDYAMHSSDTPATVAGFIQPRCPVVNAFSAGPCGRDGYCESAVSSQAVWDLVNRDLPNPGSANAWTLVDRLWFLSRPTVAAPFSCDTSGAAFTSDGCGVGSLWEVFRAIDDDDGNLANGTPHSDALFAAFNRHGIACPGDAGAGTAFAGCTAPEVPSLAATSGNNQVGLSWSSSGPAVYDVFRNETGCDGNFTRIAGGASVTSLTDMEVANGTTYYYRAAAYPSGNEACASALSACQTVTPASPVACSPPAAPGAPRVVGNDAGGVRVAYGAVPGAASYHLLRALTPGGPYTQVGTTTGGILADHGAACGGISYRYVVRAFNGCESPGSSEIAVTTAPCPVNPPPAPPALLFYTVPPCRLLDTRNPAQGQGPALQPGERRLFEYFLSCNLSLAAVTLSANVTVVQPTAAGYLNIYSTLLTPAPTTSLINFVPGQVRANSAQFGVNPNQSIEGVGFWIENHSSGTLNVIIDVNGFFVWDSPLVYLPSM